MKKFPEGKITEFGNKWSVFSAHLGKNIVLKY